ncbi:MAG: YcaO-like family protein [Bacteroidales bacterium]|nr:YcaO-like family protein [Bacteroidales bacterium]
MEQATINRKYKAEKPLKTINKIRNLLDEIGISVIEEHYDNNEGNLYSCRLRIVNNNLYNQDLGTNGKGITPEYSLASAYGELMERLQNSLVFHGNHHAYFSKRENSNLYERLEKQNALLDYSYFPDEVLHDGELFAVSFGKYLRKIFRNNNQEEISDFIKQYFHSQKHIGVQLYNVNDQEIQVLPYSLVRMMCTSNGMCAGNTPHEALMQGLGECLERFAIAQIFMNEPSLPSIPFDYFSKTAVYQELIRLQEEEDISVIIKDCSMGIGIPVILLVILNRKLNKYFVCAGADPSPVIALERCLTELYQGEVEFKMNNFSFNDQIFCSDSKESSEYKIVRSYYDNMINGKGHWPNSIFSNSESAVPNWKQFNTEKENFDYYTNLIIKLGYDIFIRDCSNLGFNTYQIYIPGISEIYYINDINDLRKLLQSSSKLSSLNKISKLNATEKKDVFDSISRVQNINTPHTFSIRDVLPPINPERLEKLDVNKLNYLLPYSFKNYELSKVQLEEHLQDGNLLNEEERLSKKVLIDYLDILSQNKSHEMAIETLSKFLSKKMIDKLEDELKIMNGFFDDEKSLLKCYDCYSCSLIDDCKIVELASISSKINAKQKKNIINQELVAQLIS